MYRVLSVITYFCCAYPVNTIFYQNLSILALRGHVAIFVTALINVLISCQVKDVMKDVMADLQQTNSEKILLSWVRQSTKNYKDTNVVNFSSSWADGFAFNALIHSHRCVELLFLGA